MNAVTIASVRKNLASLIDEVRCRKERVIITRHDKPVAALVPVDDAAFLDEFEDRLDLADALEAIEDYDANGGVDLQRLETELDQRAMGSSSRGERR